jgi:hypothetical protein
LLAAHSARVVVADLDDERGRTVADEVGGRFVHTDVTRTGDVIAATEAAAASRR